MLTVADSVQGGETLVTVYVWIPAVEMPGVNVPLNADPSGAVHVPPASGVPPNEPNSAVGPSVLHSVRSPLVPAFTAQLPPVTVGGPGTGTMGSPPHALLPQDPVWLSL